MRRKKREVDWEGGKFERQLNLLKETYFVVEIRGMGGKNLGPKGILINN